MMQIQRLVLLVTVLLPSAAIAQTKKLTADELFAPSRLVRVDIELPDADWNGLRAQTRAFAKSLGETAVTSPFRYFKGDVTIDGVRIENVGIRKKGFLGSLDRHRPSLKIKFGEFAKQSPVAGVDRLTLNNNKQDPSQASAVLALRMFRDAGVPASRCNLAEVTVNGRSLGIYSNVESIKPPFLRRAFGDGSGSLYEGTVSDFVVAKIAKFEKKTKKTALGPVTKVAEIMAADEVDLEQLDEVLDLNAFLKFWAVESLTGFWDGYTNNQNNFFVYRRPANGKLYFLPWGVDSAFVATMPVPPFVIKTKAVHSQAVLPNRLYQIPAIQTRYRTTLVNLLKTVWDEAGLFAEVDRIEKLVAGHLHANQRKSAEAFRNLRRFINTRRRVMQRSLRRWPVKLTTGPRELMRFEAVGRATAKFSTTYREVAPVDTGEAEMKLTLDGENIVFRRVSVKSERSRWPTLDGGPKPPSIVLTGVRASDGQEFFLAFSTAIEEFVASAGRSVLVQGVLFKGKLGFLNPKGIMLVSGEARMKAAGMEDGAPVRGEVSVEVAVMKGGAAPPLRRR